MTSAQAHLSIPHEFPRRSVATNQPEQRIFHFDINDSEFRQLEDIIPNTQLGTNRCFYSQMVWNSQLTDFRRKNHKNTMRTFGNPGKRIPDHSGVQNVPIRPSKPSGKASRVRKVTISLSSKSLVRKRHRNVSECKNRNIRYLLKLTVRFLKECWKMHYVCNATLP